MLLKNLIPVVFWGCTDAKCYLGRNWTNWAIILRSLPHVVIHLLEVMLVEQDSAVTCWWGYNLKSGNMWLSPLPSQTKIQHSPTNIRNIRVSGVNCFPAWKEEKTCLFCYSQSCWDIGFSELCWGLHLQGFLAKARSCAESRDYVWWLLCKKFVQVFPVSCSASSTLCKMLGTHHALRLWKMLRSWIAEGVSMYCAYLFSEIKV